MSGAQHKPGPWMVKKLSRPQPRSFYVCRDISPRPSFTHFEQLRDDDGGCAKFESFEEARAALAKVTGSAA